VTELKSEEV